MTPAEFKDQYPEFRTASDDVVAGAISDHELFVSDQWGDRREYVLGLRVADALAKSPSGRNGRLNITSDQAPIENPYAKKLMDLRRAHGWALSRT